MEHRYYSELTLELFMRLSKQGFVVIEPPPAKTNPLCKVWGGRPIYVRYDSAGGINLERAYPVALADRANTPLFPDDAGAVLKSFWWLHTFRQMLTLFM